MVLNPTSFRRAWMIMLVVGLAAAAVLYGLLARDTRAPSWTRRAAAPADWPAPPYPPAPDWSAFHAGPQRSGETPDRRERGALSRRFRLAGTFFELGDSPRRKAIAILDDLGAKRQVLVAEGDTVTDGVALVWIRNDRVLLREEEREEELTLSFADPAAASGVAGSQAAAVTAGLSTNRFGTQVETNRWVFSRQELLRYYQDVLQEPERLANVFASMKPLYQDRAITGYILDIEGEGDFFRAVGLQEGDVVRKVNSMPMTNRYRAEYFIREFVEDRVNAFVLDLERNGQPPKLIYMVR